MKNTTKPTCMIGLALALSACGETGQDLFEADLFLAGTATSSVTAGSGVQVELSRADLAFGPLYLCAGTTAGELCENARAEWLDAAVVSLISATPQSVGSLHGVTGPIRSYMYDLGITSQLTEVDAVVLPAATSLGDASLQVRGVAIVEGLRLPFSASVIAAQTSDTEQGVPVVRKAASAAFSAELDGDIRQLTLRFDPTDLFESLDFTGYVTHDSCSAGGEAELCDGSLARSCAEDGSETSNQDCSTGGQICVPGQGCQDQITLDSSTTGYRQLLLSLLNGTRPQFNWE